MIGFDNIGTMGRLGNQMFQHAAVKGIARNRGFEYCIPPYHPQSQIDNYGLFEAFEMENVDHVKFSYNMIPAQESHFHFDEELFNDCPDGANVAGFFQTEKYFKHVEDEVREDYTFKKEWLEPCQEFMKQFGNQEVAFLHVRRGDPNLTDKRGFKWAYVNLQDQHPVQPLEYYEKALEYFPKDMPVLVFSDSIEWCKEQEFFKPERFMFSEPEDKYDDGALVPYVDLCLMSLCSHAIIANSSMSWWGAWLQKNPNKKVIAPKMWFGSTYSFHDTKDLYCDGWEVI
jgi:hypothetical protein